MLPPLEFLYSCRVVSRKKIAASSTDSPARTGKGVTSATFFKPRVPGEANQVPTPATAPFPKDEDVPHHDELAAYLSLPQVDWVSDWDALVWWEKNAKKFPNLSVMARQYLGCPATSATVERLFSQVGISFSPKRQRAQAATVADIIFTKINVA